VTERVQRALTLGVKAGLVAAAWGLFNVVRAAVTERIPRPDLLFVVPLVPVMSFALFFGLVFLLAYGFPPTQDTLSRDLSFPGAGWVVWPLMALLTAGTVYLVVHSR
jgi:hypothetical protein